jgi:hypothetical protein
MKKKNLKRAVEAAGNIDELRALAEAAEGDLDTEWYLCLAIFDMAVDERRTDYFSLALEMDLEDEFIIDNSHVQGKASIIATMPSLLAHVIDARTLDATGVRFDLGLANNQLFRIATGMKTYGSGNIESVKLLLEARNDDGTFRVDPGVDDNAVLFLRFPTEIVALVLRSYDDDGRLRVDPMARGNTLVQNTVSIDVFEALLDCTNPVVEVYDVMQVNRSESRWDMLGPLMFRDNATLARVKLDEECYGFLSRYPEYWSVYFKDHRIQEKLLYFTGLQDLFTMSHYIYDAAELRRRYSTILEAAGSVGTLDIAIRALRHIYVQTAVSVTVAKALAAEYEAYNERWGPMRMAWLAAVAHRAQLRRDSDAVSKSSDDTSSK